MASSVTTTRSRHPASQLLARHQVLRRGGSREVIRSEGEGIGRVRAVSHGLASLYLADQPFARSVDYILGADTHGASASLTREVLQVTSLAPSPLSSATDLVVERGAIKDETCSLLDVDPIDIRKTRDEEARVGGTRAVKREISRVIGRTRTPLRYYVIETPMDNLITDALMWKFDTDFVVSNGFRFCPPLVPPDGGEADITAEYLWSMLPVDSVLKTGVVTGKQIRDWLERELESAFARDATRRFGGWFVRYKGLFVRFTIGNPMGRRLRQVTVRGEPLADSRRYTVLGCEREGDPDDMVCRIAGVGDPRRQEITVHQVVTEYLALHSPVSPPWRAAPCHRRSSGLLSQAQGRATSSDRASLLLPDNSA